MIETPVGERSNSRSSPISTRRKLVYLVVLISPIPAFVLSMLVGSYSLSIADVVDAVFARLTGGSADASLVILDIRMPRIVAAGLCGMAISVAGATLQGVLRNPLVDPYILGLSSGGAFGAALSIVVIPWLPVQAGAFVFALVALAIAYSMARTNGETPIVALVLSGVITSSIFTALLSIVQIMATERSLQAIVFWIMGSFNGTTWGQLEYVWFPILAGTAIIFALRWRLNVLALGDREAASVGMPVERYRLIFVVCSALIAAMAVSIAGVVALVGLIIPHMIRMMLGPDHRRLIPATAALGATFLMLVDDLARTIGRFEIPISIITTLVGAPFFWLLLRRTSSASWN